MAGCSIWVVEGWAVAANHGVGGYSTSSRNAWALLNGNSDRNRILKTGHLLCVSSYGRP
jgi:hypothetical protein